MLAQGDVMVNRVETDRLLGPATALAPSTNPCLATREGEALNKRQK